MSMATATDRDRKVHGPKKYTYVCLKNKICSSIYYRGHGKFQPPAMMLKIADVRNRLIRVFK